MVRRRVAILRNLKEGLKESRQYRCGIMVEVDKYWESFIVFYAFVLFSSQTWTLVSSIRCIKSEFVEFEIKHLIFGLGYAQSGFNSRVICLSFVSILVCAKPPLPLRFQALKIGALILVSTETYSSTLIEVEGFKRWTSWLCLLSCLFCHAQFDL